MFEISFVFSHINLEKTGMRLKRAIFNAGYSVSDIQKYLKLSCPQPIYRWFRGKTLPSLDNLFALSRLLNTHIECLLVAGYYIDCCDFEHIDYNEQMERLKRFENITKESTVLY